LERADIVEEIPVAAIPAAILFIAFRRFIIAMFLFRIAVWVSSRIVTHWFPERQRGTTIRRPNDLLRKRICDKALLALRHLGVTASVQNITAHVVLRRFTLAEAALSKLGRRATLFVNWQVAFPISGACPVDDKYGFGPSCL
jgi:hypothetical protein